MVLCVSLDTYEIGQGSDKLESAILVFIGEWAGHRWCVVPFVEGLSSEVLPQLGTKKDDREEESSNLDRLGQNAVKSPTSVLATFLVGVDAWDVEGRAAVDAILGGLSHGAVVKVGGCGQK